MEGDQIQHHRADGEEDENEIKVEHATFSHAGPVEDDTKLPPKVDSEVEVLHEKVTKQIIKEGYGPKPARFSRCFLHYRAWTESTLHKFEDTWQEQHPLELVIGKEKTEMTGLAIGILSMKSGERALLRVSWELGYGREGSFSFPNVPPMADLLYEVELIGVDETNEGKSRGEMTVEERIAAADRRRMQGNDLFKEDKLEEAIQQYEMVLAEDENNVKALFRRGKARAELGQSDDARADFLMARKHAPHDNLIVRELRLLDEHDRALYQKQKEIYKGMFGPRPEPKKTKLNWICVFWQWLVSLFHFIFRRHRRVKDD